MTAEELTSIDCALASEDPVTQEVVGLIYRYCEDKKLNACACKKIYERLTPDDFNHLKKVVNEKETVSHIWQQFDAILK